MSQNLSSAAIVIGTLRVKLLLVAVVFGLNHCHAEYFHVLHSSQIFILLSPKNGMWHSATPRCIHTPNLIFLCQIIQEICSGHDYSITEVRGQGHSDPKMVYM